VAESDITQQQIDWMIARERRFAQEEERIGILRALVLEQLRGGLWHTTHPDRFKGIVLSKAILSEPDIPEKKRWNTSRGKDYYPYVRTIGGVSLFDFDEFNPDQYQDEYPLSTWHQFIPYRSRWKSAVWIEIDREQIASHFVSGAELIHRWKLDNAQHHMIMPIIEAACLKAIPCAAFKRVFSVRKGSDGIEPMTFHRR
jgi:hypothetical protein